MIHNDFGGAVIPAMAGFFFGKRAKVQEIREEEIQHLPVVVNSQLPGLTGVSKYLATVPLVTSVTRYMKKKEKQQISGVEKYVLRQAINEKNKPAPSGVAKYISRVEKDTSKHKKTSVDKYLTKLDIAECQIYALTGVAKYQAEQNIIERKKTAAILVEQYKQSDAAAAILAKEAAEAAAIKTSKIKYQKVSQMEAPRATGVGRYLQAEEMNARNKAKATGVAKYLAKKIILDSQKPILSKVEKYLRDQNLSGNKKPTLTGVEKYLSKQPNSNVSTTSKTAKVISGVEKYLSELELAQRKKPVRSGVSKYLENQAKTESQNIKLIGNIIEEMHIPIEGEFIPARQVDDASASATGVSKYLERQKSVLESAELVIKHDTFENLTGVARYLDRKAEGVVLVSDVKPTGVDRYLQSRA